MDGTCPQCGAAAAALCAWVEIDPVEGRATLHCGPSERADLVELLRAHLDRVKERPDTPGYVIQPEVQFSDDLERTNPRATARATERESPEPIEDDPTAGVPLVVGEHGFETQELVDGIEVAYTTMLELDETAGLVRVDLTIDDAGRRLFGTAALQARPIHLRAHGYPTVGVRIVASYLGRVSLVDAVCDVAVADTNDIFVALSHEFRLSLVVRSETGSAVVDREVDASGLERNAALCLESARAALASGEFPADAFGRAVHDLAQTSVAARLFPAAHPLAEGAYRHLVSAGEAVRALEDLVRVSDKQNLAHLLEVDGLPVGEYEAVRRRVLESALEQGICAPRQFWRRVIASGLAADPADYANQLARNRARFVASGDDDLDSTRQRDAWDRIAKLCSRKDVPWPDELVSGLGLEAAPVRAPRGSGNMAAAGEIRTRPRMDDASARSHARPHLRVTSGELALALGDPERRLEAALAALSDAPGNVDALAQIMESAEAFAEDELLSLVPAIAAMGELAVPVLNAKLDSGVRAVRQAAAILLGRAHHDSSMAPLVEGMVGEPTTAWVDMARALGGFGTAVLGPLCAKVREADAAGHGTRVATRVTWAMAEVAVADGEEGGPGQDAVEALADAPERAVSLAASRALATLHEVALVGAQVRGQRPLGEVTQVRGFSRRAHEAIARAVSDVDEIMELDELDML